MFVQLLLLLLLLLLPTFIDAPRIPAARGHQTVLCVGGAQRSRRLGHAKGLVESARRRSWRGTKHVDGRVIVRARVQIGAKSPQTHPGGGHGTRTLRRRGVGHIDCIHGSFYRPVVGVRRVRKWFRRHSLAILARFCPHVGRVRNVLLTVGARGKSNDENQNDRHENHSKRNTNFHCIHTSREKVYLEEGAPADGGGGGESVAYKRESGSMYLVNTGFTTVVSNRRFNWFNTEGLSGGAVLTSVRNLPK